MFYIGYAFFCLLFGCFYYAAGLIVASGVHYDPEEKRTWGDYLVIALWPFICLGILLTGLGLLFFFAPSWLADEIDALIKGREESSDMVVYGEFDPEQDDAGRPKDSTGSDTSGSN